MKAGQLRMLLSSEYIIKEVIKAHRFILNVIENTPDDAFSPYLMPTSKGLKPLVVVDLLAERLFINAVITKFGKNNIRIEGEEKLQEELDLTDERRICVLIDMIDGTDLLQRGLSNWCSAIVMFDPHPQRKRIEGAFIAQRGEPEDYLYFAIRATTGAFKKRLSIYARDNPTIPLGGPKREKQLRDTTMCMYGQKSNALLELLKLDRKPKFVAWLQENIKLDDELKKAGKGDLKFRFYNLAGNPMMTRLADGIVDIIIDLKGQAPHDVVPGAFIASKAGAVLGKTTGEELLLSELEEKLLHPGAHEPRIKYILSANKESLREIAELLND